MSNAIVFKVDAKEVDAMFVRLDFNSKEMKKAVSSGLARSSNVIKKQGIVNLRSVAYKQPLPETGLLSKGISVGLWRKAAGSTIGLFQKRTAVTYQGKKYKNPSYLLRWIDAGTSVRKTKKGYNRGVLGAKHFFSDAVEQSGSIAAENLADNVAKAIERIAAKR